MQKIIKVTAAILEKDSQIIIAQRKSSDHLSGLWEFPGGKIELGETPEECLARELKEEFDIDVEVGELFGSNFHHYNHISIELMPSVIIIDRNGSCSRPGGLECSNTAAC